jgi:hypothetical protein
LGELDVLAGVIFDGDDGVPALGRLLDHYQLTPVCIRRPGDARPMPPAAIAARALSIEALMGGKFGESELLMTTDGPVASLVAPEALLRASRSGGAWHPVIQAPGNR